MKTAPREDWACLFCWQVFDSQKNHSAVSAHTNNSTGIWTVAREDKVETCWTPFSCKKWLDGAVILFMILWLQDAINLYGCLDNVDSVLLMCLVAWYWTTFLSIWFHLAELDFMDWLLCLEFLSSTLQAKNNTVPDSHPSEPPTVCKTHTLTRFPSLLVCTATYR